MPRFSAIWKRAASWRSCWGAPKPRSARCLERLDAPERVEAVSLDMSLVFCEAVQMCLLRTRIVVDHFHVVQHLSRALAQVLSRCARRQEGRAALKGQRPLFVRTAEDLTPEEDERRTQLAEGFSALAAA